MCVRVDGSATLLKKSSSSRRQTQSVKVYGVEIDRMHYLTSTLRARDVVWEPLRDVRVFKQSRELV